MYIRKDSKVLFSTLLNWFELVYGPFGKSKIHRTFETSKQETSIQKVHCEKNIGTLPPNYLVLFFADK